MVTNVTRVVYAGIQWEDFGAMRLLHSGGVAREYS